ncbi:carbohydrate porin [Vibrio sp. SM6]|uniref:Carbohydrate porin n=1 Tax=Vibrio agarilyticus TaxID=2726741 RepID=A0A7X8TTZ3_9VIBR|nr:carbohydrate porin [Vibrio agarilyticus]NLS14877.1 carbohydrate porin [Vibrio agarilyticus]
MKLNVITKSLTAGLLIVAAPSMAIDTTAELHGYIKSGLLLNSDGTRVNSIGLFTNLGKFRLGNEQNTKIELLPTLKMTADNGAWAKVRANLTHETNCTSDWNCVDGDGHDIQFREGYVELGGLDFAPELVFWAGKRYSTSNTSSHQFDWEYIQYNGTGGGVDKIDLGFAQMDVGLYAFMPSDRNGEEPVDKSVQGYSEDLSLNMWLKKIGGTGLDLQLAGHRMEEHAWHKGAADNGLGVAAIYNFDGFYNFANGFSRTTLQYGKGLAAGDSLGKNGWGFANSEDTKSGRIVFDGVVNLSSSWEMSTFAFYQKDTDFNAWADWSNPTTKGYDRDLYAVGLRPFNQITPNFAMQYELSYQNIKEDKADGADGGMYQVTIAPTIMPDVGFWTRPQIRAFVTYAKWDDDVASRLDAGYTRDNKTDTLNFGIQAEVWF